MPTVPSGGSTEMATLHAPRHLTCLDRPLLSTPAALYAHRKGIILTLLLRGTSVLVGVLLTAKVVYSRLSTSKKY